MKKPIVILGVRYDSKTEASRKINVDYGTICKYKEGFELDTVVLSCLVAKGEADAFNLVVTKDNVRLISNSSLAKKYSINVGTVCKLRNVFREDSEFVFVLRIYNKGIKIYNKEYDSIEKVSRSSSLSSIVILNWCIESYVKKVSIESLIERDGYSINFIRYGVKIISDTDIFPLKVNGVVQKSIPDMSRYLGLSVSSIRSCLRNTISLEEFIGKANSRLSKYSLATIVSYEKVDNNTVYFKIFNKEFEHSSEGITKLSKFVKINRKTLIGFINRNGLDKLEDHIISYLKIGLTSKTGCMVKRF